ncbi:MAG: 23S rRNA (uridine(2552)-2'-O)-methyltransferase RlmE [Candidatus Symbiodolus clandestinus]
MSRRSSSKRWLQAHITDHYVQQAKRLGLRSRAWFKLEQLQQRDRLFKPGMTVVDLGATPGGWSQYSAQCVGSSGRVLACDWLPMNPINGVEFLQGDFSNPAVVNQLLAQIGQRKVSVVLSDMAPNLTGLAVVDQARSLHLAELVLELSQQILVTDGALVIKLFQGSGFDDYLRVLRRLFTQVKVRKPSASRQASKELYLVARGYKL